MPPKTATETPPWTPPRGIRYEHRPGRKKPFLLFWSDRTGKRKAAAYGSESVREIAARALADKREEFGAAVMTFSPREWQTWQEFRAEIGEAEPMQVAREWKALRQGAGTDRAAGLTVAQAVAEYLRLRRSEETLSADTWRHFDKHLSKRFAGVFGSMRLCDVTADNVRTWLSGLTNPRTNEPMEALTKKHHRKDVSTFFDRARREGWILRNPCEVVSAPSVDDGDVSVIPIADAIHFFEVNRAARVTPRVALEAFGALRYSTAARIGKGSFNFDENGIAIAGAIHKSGRRKFRQGHPPNLWAWLAVATAETWKMTPLQYREEKRAALYRAGLRPLVAENDDDRAQLRGLRNVWRHSFASYHLAAFKNPPLTGYLMQHTNTKTTEVYEGVATEADAKKFFSILP
jgi:site-specific recombinase XerD